ncbi:MAG: hypothetical protein LBQ32_08665 [Burkholderiaceae bacterium]|nr:hypothetical protein [Burkholderiaceae bacterium]
MSTPSGARARLIDVLLLGALVAWVWFGERPGGWRVFGPALGFGGTG